MRTTGMVVGALALGLAGWGQAPTMMMMRRADLAQQLNRSVNSVESEVIGAAEAMPAAKYSFAPTPSLGNFAGVRTFAQQVKHVAVSNYHYGAAILGQPAPVGLGENENGPANLQSKEQILKLLRDSFAYAHRAIDTITSANALEPAKPGQGAESRLMTAVQIPAHCEDHYGQMVEYLRMNGLTPPASAKSKPANPAHP